MARKTRPTPKTPANTVKSAILAMVDALWDKHENEIESFRDEAEDKTVKVNFGAVIDYSKSDPALKVSIRFSQSVTDEASTTLDDPTQGTFELRVGRQPEGSEDGEPEPEAA